MVDPVDDTYRGQVNRQLTVHSPVASSPATVPRQARHHPSGAPRRDGGPARRARLNAAALWATKYIDAAVTQLKAEGHELRDEDVARLSPLKHLNLNLPARYTAPRPLCGWNVSDGTGATPVRWWKGFRQPPRSPRPLPSWTSRPRTRFWWCATGASSATR
ncbi:Tn3 family transposase [[Kitasatospora] papulosa]|uniref:Tn3 family transposase n=1 Tax=[Kitasatospora] papulosa TaxID=1464011 RepID=UPI0036934B0E